MKSRLDQPTNEELLLQIKAGDPLTAARAKAALIDQNSGLVAKIAAKFHARWLHFDDLMVEGQIGLLHAAQTFDPGRGCRFSTHATQWIRQAVSRAIATQDRCIRIPDWYMTDAARRETAPAVTNSLDDLLEDGETRFGDCLPSGDGDPEEIALGRLTRDEMVALVERTCNPREIHFITRRYGLRDDIPRSLQELGDELCLSREGARQTQERALKKLRKEINADVGF